ncbi:MAG: ABC transporter permease [Calditrichia bacterium]
MFKSYFKIALRNLVKNKIYSIINIAGLAIGLACFILISIFIKNELSYDAFHEKKDRIYRPVEIQHPPGVGTQHVAVTMGPLAPALKNDFPEVQEAVRIFRRNNIYFKIGENGYYENSVSFADPSIFNVFSIPLIKGDPDQVLNSPTSMVISERIARKFFGNEDPVGKVMTVSHYWGQDEFTVTGVMENYPENSHLEFEILGPYAYFENRLDWLQSWGTNTMATYILLREGADAEALQAKFPEFIRKYHEYDDPERQMELYLQPLTDIHLHSGHIVYQTFNHQQGDINNIYLFSVIAIFILVIACINFMNLATARSARRSREVGIRKVLGSTRRQLILQFLGESLLVSFLALALALVLVEVLFPYFESLVQGRLINTFYTDTGFLLQMLGITLLVGVVAGSYPAFFLSSFQPAQTLKATFSSGKRGALLRKSLVVFQFTIAIALIVCTGIVMDQMDYIRNKDLGFNKEQVVYIPLRSSNSRQKIDLLKNELSRNANIVSVSATAGLSGASGSQGDMHVAGGDEDTEMMVRFSYVDYDYIKTMQMNILQGRDFSKEFAADTTTSVIINETAVREFGWENPIGKQFVSRTEGGPDYEVVGVVNDFNFYSLRQKIEPLIMWVNPQRVNYLVARIKPGEVRETIRFIEDTWKKQLPAEPVEVAFLDEHLDQIYQNDRNTGRLFASFSFLAIFIGCLGLFGLVSFTVEQKTKEIGIRKVLGASVGGIVLMLSKEFIKWIAVASLIAFGVAYWAMQDWLSNFVYRTGIHPLTFIIGALLVLFIAIATISWQAVRAATANPVDALRYE